MTFLTRLLPQLTLNETRPTDQQSTIQQTSKIVLDVEKQSEQKDLRHSLPPTVPHLETVPPLCPADSGVYDVDHLHRELSNYSSSIVSDLSLESDISFPVEQPSSILDSDLSLDPQRFPSSTSLESFPQFLDVAGSYDDEEPSLSQLNQEEDQDPLKIREYSEEIFQYLTMLDSLYHVDGNYIERQPYITWDMRRVLVDWLIQLHHQLPKLVPETLHLTVNLMDRFLSKCQGAIMPEKFQLLGTSCLLLAAKYEEIDPPLVASLISACGDIYTRLEFRQAEIYIMETLNWNLTGGWANILEFLRRASRAEGYDTRTRTVGKYLIELMLLGPEFIAVPNRVKVCAAAWIARQVVGKIEPWTPSLSHHLGISPSNPQVQECIQNLIATLEKPPASVSASLFKKYSGTKVFKAAKWCQEWATSHCHPAGMVGMISSSPTQSPPKTDKHERHLRHEDMELGDLVLEARRRMGDRRESWSQRV